MEAVIVSGLSIIPSFSWLLFLCAQNSEDHLIVSLNALYVGRDEERKKSSSGKKET